MAVQNDSGLLTPAARSLVDELADDYRTQLLTAAEASAAQLTGYPREVSVHDVVIALRQVQRLSEARRDRYEGILTIYGVLGVALAAIGFSFWVIKYAALSSSITEQLPILIGLSGILLAASSMALLRLRRIRLSNQPPSNRSLEGSIPLEEMKFVATWRDIELALRAIASHEFGESDANLPVSLLIDLAGRAGITSEQDALRLQQLVKTRNNILHKGSAISSAELENALEVAELIRRRIVDHGSRVDAT